jgi:Ca2+/Na+ antiporter
MAMEQKQRKGNRFLLMLLEDRGLRCKHLMMMKKKMMMMVVMMMMVLVMVMMVMMMMMMMMVLLMVMMVMMMMMMMMMMEANVRETQAGKCMDLQRQEMSSAPMKKENTHNLFGLKSQQRWLWQILALALVIEALEAYDHGKHNLAMVIEALEAYEHGKHWLW